MPPICFKCVDGDRLFNNNIGDWLVGAFTPRLIGTLPDKHKRDCARTDKCNCHIDKNSSKSFFTYPLERRQPRADHLHCHRHGQTASTCYTQCLHLTHFWILFFISIVFLHSSSSVSGYSLATKVGFSTGDKFGSRLLSAPSQISPPSESLTRNPMSPNLKQFSTLNDDLVFEDSVDVLTNHYNETDQQASASVVMPASDGSSRFIRILPDQSHQQMQTNRREDSFHNNGRIGSEHSRGTFNHYQIRKLGPHSHSSQFVPLEMPKSTVTQLASNHLNQESISDLAPRGQSVPLVNRDILPKRSDLNRIEMIRPNDLADNSISSHSLSADLSMINDTSVDLSSIVGDHILRPFFRRQRKLQENEKQVVLGKVNRSKAHLLDQSNWSLPVVELKRLSDHSRPNSSGNIFKKRLPLMSNEEGFVLTKPNSSLQNKERSIDKRMDNSVAHAKHEFKRRFGDLSNEPNSNHGANKELHQQSKPTSNFGPNDPFRMGYLMDDISMNDLDLDDIGPSPMPIGPRNSPKNFKSRKPVVPNQQNGQFDQASPIGGPQGQPISQIMPLFFDKFLSEFGNSNAHLSPEGFSLPLNKAKLGPFEQAQPGPHSNPHMLPPINQIDSDLGDLDAPNLLERRLINGNLPMHKPEIGPPLFSNEIGPPNEFDNEFGPWPKIFRFTDGRINLHDFEREKKRSRIKFSPKLTKSQSLFNIKRDSFLILHGGTFSQ